MSDSVTKYFEMQEEKVHATGGNLYIYESPDGGKTVYRRDFGSIERELIQEPDRNEVNKQKAYRILAEYDTDAVIMAYEILVRELDVKK